ncbi:hypothetical protein DUZ99_08545 [Xylanibacillus composti]|nr:hypothetical protein [Xylanibacillus composti]
MPWFFRGTAIIEAVRILNKLKDESEIHVLNFRRVWLYQPIKFAVRRKVKLMIDTEHNDHSLPF